jgi:ketosteroid isomerase-like protein
MKLYIIIITALICWSCSNSEQIQHLEAQLKTLNTKHTQIMNTATKNKNTVKAFFDALTAEDAQAVAELFAENATHINPYHSGIFPTGANGKTEIQKYWEPVFPNFDGMTFPIEELYAMEDPNMVFVKYTGKIKLKNNAGVYSNNYYSTFKFNDSGKIIEYVEIFNPIVAARGFGLLEQIK